MPPTYSAGYFACAQYDVLFLYVILNDSEESHRKSAEVYALTLGWWDISLALNMTYLFWGIAAVAMLPRNDNEKRNCRVCGLQ